ncbi:helix-turn-helix transcriptional regulator [Enterococcus faecium]|jgi:putative transcriptional regulator|nr:helix-turn-helix transcriptional regulator [Enterococcus faecium]MDQ8470599.1 helix-turn-helix transcriptional regulator [Enterococcus faecium]
MPITYKKLWKLLIDKGMNKTQLKEVAQVSTNVIAKLGKDEPVAMESLIKIAEALKVDIGDIVSMEGGKQDNVKKS